MVELTKRTTLLQMLESLKSQIPGTRYLIKHLYGEKISRGQAMAAKCSDCQGYYIDGREDCKIPECPMYGYMPYREKKEKVSSGKVLSDEQKEKMREGRMLRVASKMPSNDPE